MYHASDLDWNSFFSTYAESSATIIGILGAFLITRLVDFISKVNGFISEYNRLVIKFKTLSDTFDIDVTTAPTVQSGLDAQHNIIFQGMSEPKKQKKLHKLKVESYATIMEFEKNKNDFTDLQASVIPIKKVLVVICLAFPLCVILPLFCLPATTGSPINLGDNPDIWIYTLFTFKSVLLLVFLLIIEWFFIFLLRLSKRVDNKISRYSLKKYDYYTNINNYVQL